MNSMPKTQMIHEQSFKKILSEIGRSLPSTSLLSLEIMHDKYKVWLQLIKFSTEHSFAIHMRGFFNIDFFCFFFCSQAGKTSRDAVIRHLRSVAGDKLLASAIRRVRGS